MILMTLPGRGQSLASSLQGPFQAEIIDVIDGDTVRARVQIWLGQYIEQTIRIKGIDTPEKRSECAFEKKLARQAKNALSHTLNDTTVTLRNVENGKYAGRVLADINIPDGDVATIMLVSGHARPYQGGKRHSWCALHNQ